MLTTVQCSLVQNKYLMVLYTGIMHQSSDVASWFSSDKKYGLMQTSFGQAVPSAAQLMTIYIRHRPASPIGTSVAIALM